MTHEEKEEDIEYYGDPGIATKDAKVPIWLILTYIILPIWGVWAFTMYWNGSHGWLDRGYWQQLQRAANTTFPQAKDLSNTKLDDSTAPRPRGSTIESDSIL